MDGSEIAVAVVAPFVVPLLVVLARSGGLAAAKPGELRYSRGLRWLALALLLVPPLGLLAILVFTNAPLRPQDRAPFAGMLIGFPLLATPLVLEFFRVQHRFDDARFSFRSPWSKHRSVAWLDVSSLRWRKFLRSLDFKSNGGEIYRVSPYLAGLPAFADVALARIPPAVLAASPESRAVLLLMSAGEASSLMLDATPPEKRLASITRPPGTTDRE